MSFGKKFLICPILPPMSDLTPFYGTSTVPQSMLRKQNPGSPRAAAAHSGPAFDPMGARLGSVKRVRFSCGNILIPQVFNPSPPTFKPTETHFLQ